MRRNTLLPQKSALYAGTTRRHRTMIQKQQNLLSLSQQNDCSKMQFRHSQSIARSFIEEELMDKIEQEINRRQLQKIVDQTLDQCIRLLHNQNWQVTPKGPFSQRQKEAKIRPDEEPKVKRFDPVLGFNKSRQFKSAKVQTQTSLQFSRFKMNSILKQQKLNIAKSGSKNSINSRHSISSKLNSTITKEFPKLIPLKLDNITITPEGSYRRNLEDILREKKINAEINLGYKMKYFDEKENSGLKTIQEFPKSNFLVMPNKNQPFIGQAIMKLPLISPREECGIDYDGTSIPLKKISNKKSGDILKTLCKVKKTMEEIKRPLHQKKKVDIIKFRPRTIRNDSVNLLSLTERLGTEEDFKTVIEQSLLTNRIKFREMDENQPGTIYESVQMK